MPRKRRNDALKLIASGIDPGEERKAGKVAIGEVTDAAGTAVGFM